MILAIPGIIPGRPAGHRRDDNTGRWGRRLAAGMKITAIVFIAVSVFAGHRAYAWDGRHKGFVIGIGAGPARATGMSGEAVYVNRLQTDFKIGYAVSDKVQIHYFGSTIWSMGDVIDHFMICVTHYTKPEAPTSFVSAGLGSSMQAWNILDGGYRTGSPSLQAGAGYEFLRHLNAEATLLATRLEHTGNWRWYFHLGVNLLVY